MLLQWKKTGETLIPIDTKKNNVPIIQYEKHYIHVCIFLLF